jgi:hypothetical protein
MPEIHIPLVSGIDEAIDAKLLPNGSLTALTDVRFRKQGKIGPRHGYDLFILGSDVGIASAEWARTVTLQIVDRVSLATPAQVVINAVASAGAQSYGDSPNFGTNATGFNSSLTTLGGVTRMALPAVCVAGNAGADTATAGKYFVCVTCDMDVIGGGATPAGTLVATHYDKQTLTALGTQTITGTFTNPHLVAIGTTIRLFYANGTSVASQGDNTSSGTDPKFDGTPVVAGTATSATAAKYHHAAAYDSSNAVVCFQSGATTMEWGYVTSAGVYTQKATWSVTNTVRPCICRVGNGSSNVAVIWGDGATLGVGNCSYAIWDSTGAVVTATTALDSTGQVCGYPMVAPVAATGGLVFVWSDDRGPAATNSNRTTLRNVSGTISSVVYNMVAAALPFTLGFGVYVWMVDAAKTQAAGSAIGFATYRLFDAFQGTTAGSGPGGLPIQGGCANLKALPAKYLMNVAAVNDPRRNVTAAVSQSPMPGLTAAATVLPVLGNNGIFVPQLVCIEAGTFAERLQSAKVQNQLIFSGPRVCTYDGATFYPSGLFSGPAEIYAADGGVVGSGLDAGTYQYVAVWELIDANGQRTFSAPSNPVSITVAGNHQVNLTTSTPPPFGTRVSPYFDLNLRWFRTLAGQTVFYAIANVATPAYVNTDKAAAPAVADIATDAVIRLNEVLYTQGERGGMSGLLQNDEPPSAKFVAAGSDRVILGGLDDATAVQFSKLAFPGEPIQWTGSDSHRVLIDEPVTGVAWLDGLWYVFSRSSIYVISGVGPDDSGQGSFDSARKLPSSVGCVSGRSIVETRDGLMFQGQAGVYLVPRGGGAPQWIGERVQDVLASYPYVVAAYFEKNDGLAYFACVDAAGTSSTLLVYDVEHGQWIRDTISAAASFPAISNIAAFNGQVILNGGVQQSASAFLDRYSGSVVVAPVITTGDIRPFGTLGHGRTRKVVILGELRSASNSTMLVEVSTDSGTTYSTIGTFTLAGTAGTSFRRECLLKYQLETAFRFRITLTPSSTSVEAPVLNDITLEVFKSEGTSRLAAAERA